MHGFLNNRASRQAVARHFAPDHVELRDSSGDFREVDLSAEEDAPLRRSWRETLGDLVDPAGYFGADTDQGDSFWQKNRYEHRDEDDFFPNSVENDLSPAILYFERHSGGKASACRHGLSGALPSVAPFRELSLTPHRAERRLGRHPGPALQVYDP